MEQARKTVHNKIKHNNGGHAMEKSISPVTPMPEVRRAKFLVVFFCL